MSIPKEPRQQMINIMYLVLIALLALNVSAEILNAFRLINNSIEASNTTSLDKISNTMGAFEAKVKKEKRGQEYLDAAQQARVIANDFRSYIDGLDQRIIDEVGLDTTQMAYGKPKLAKPDDQDVTTRLFVEEDSIAYQLRDKIEDTRTKLLALFPDAEREAVASRLNLETKEPEEGYEEGEDWAGYTFRNMPATAARTLLTKYKSDAIAAESTVVDEMFGKVGEKTIIFDKFKVALVPNSRRFYTGETFEADIYLAASSSQSAPKISVNGRSLSPNADGVASFKQPVGNSPGKKSVNAKITTLDGAGRPVTRDAKLEYEVEARPKAAAVVSADKMNVFYIGVDNPVSASIAGVPNAQTNVSMNGGTITPKGAGTFSVRVTSPGKATINVSGPLADGSNFTDSKEFRKLFIPDPIAEVGGKSGGAMGTGEFRAQRGVVANLKDFVFDARFDVLGFELTRAPRSGDLLIATNAGATFSGKAANLVKQASVGDVYYFDNIRVKGPDGKNRKLPTIAFKIR